MTNITEEEGLSKDDSSEHISALTGAAHTRKHALICVDRILKPVEKNIPLTSLTQQPERYRECMRPRLSPREGPGQEVWILAGKSVVST